MLRIKRSRVVRFLAMMLVVVTIGVVLVLATVSRAEGQQAKTNFRSLYSFTGNADGGAPWGSLIKDSFGNLYGTTYYGGAYYEGTVFKLDVTGLETVLYSFTGGQDGGKPHANLIGDAEGNLYGTTYYGGTAEAGTVFKLDSVGIETVLHSFHVLDGSYPAGGLLRDQAGNLYGTTVGGGVFDVGTVFKLDPTGKLTHLHNFTGSTDGANPQARLIRDASGNLWGTTYVGGAAQAGTIFKLDASGNGAVVYSFSQSSGANPYAGLVRDSNGNLYGTTSFGGSFGFGTVFKLDAAGNETVLYSFAGSTDGAQPLGSLILDGTGALYGTTQLGGTYSLGTVFKVDSVGNHTILHSFNGTDGANPVAGLVRGNSGSLYGTTLQGGSYGYGTVFEITPF